MSGSDEPDRGPSLEPVERDEPVEASDHPYVRVAREKGITLYPSLGAWNARCWMGENHQITLIPDEERWFCFRCRKAGKTLASLQLFLESWPDEAPVRAPPQHLAQPRPSRTPKAQFEGQVHPLEFYGSLQDGPEVDVLKIAGLGDLWVIENEFPAVRDLPSGHALLSQREWIDWEIVGEDEKGPGLSDTYVKYTVRDWQKLISEVRNLVKEALDVEAWPEDLELGFSEE